MDPLYGRGPHPSPTCGAQAPQCWDPDHCAHLEVKVPQEE